MPTAFLRRQRTFSDGSMQASGLQNPRLDSVIVFFFTVTVFFHRHCQHFFFFFFFIFVLPAISAQVLRMQ